MNGQSNNGETDHQYLVPQLNPVVGKRHNKMKILLTNDNIFQLKFIHILMKKATDNCMEASLAKNGHEAL